MEKKNKFNNLIPCKNLVDIVNYNSCAKEVNGYGCSVCDNCEECIEYKLEKLGYCKADVVRKETAKEILQTLFNHITQGAKDNDNGFAFACNQMKTKILTEAEKYGVEINE